MSRTRFYRWLRKFGMFCLFLTGCGTTRLTDTLRTGTEQLLVSNAIDQAVSQLDFRHLAGKTVFLDSQFLEGVIDRGYLISSVRQHLVASGCYLQEDRAKAKYVVEVRSGGVGTNRSALLVGIPQMNVPTFVPGQPSSIPEIPFAKKTDQEGVAKIAVFCYNRLNGQPVWQSGVVQSISTSKDTWVFGAGPFQQGSIRKGLEFAGEPIPVPTFSMKPANENDPTAPAISVSQAASWLEGDAGSGESRTGATANQTLPSGWISLRARQMLGHDPGTNGPANPVEGRDEPAAKGKNPPTGGTAADPKLFPTPPIAPNSGGQVETEPTNVFNSGVSGGKPASPADGDWNRLLHPSADPKGDKPKGSGR